VLLDVPALLLHTLSSRASWSCLC